MDTLSDDWLELAASHGATQWVKQFIKTYLPQLRNQDISPQQFAVLFTDQLDSRHLSTPAQQKNYRSNLCQALKTLDPDHGAIALVSLTTQEFRELNDAQRGKLADRETRYLTSDQAQALVDRATALLDSSEWSDVAAGLAVLIGRRISEILLSRFSLKSPWSITFSGMAKKANTAGLTIEIPTLAPAQTVLKAIAKLQTGLNIEDLKINSLSPKMAKQVVNQRYSESVAARCVAHFRDLVPARSDRESLYTHVFRACYATLAAHWYCPPHIPEHLFKAEIQGHFTLSNQGRKLPNYSARANYDDYAIGTEDGNRDGRLGIKLGILPGLEVIDAFRKETFAMEMEKETLAMEGVTVDKDKELNQLVVEAVGTEDLSEDFAASKALQVESELPRSQEELTLPELATKVKIRRPALHADDVDEMTALMARRGVLGTPGELFHALLTAFKAGESETLQLQSLTVQDFSSRLGWFTDRIDALESTCRQLQEERDQLRLATTTTEELNRLRHENARLRQQLAETDSQLLGIKQFLGLGADGAVTTPLAEAQPFHEAASVTSPATRRTTVASTRRNRGETDEKLHRIVDALMAWNASQDGSDSRLRISFPAVKALASALGANYQRAIQEILQERESELEEHHNQLLIGSRHNARVSHKDALLQAIARDFLRLENWQDVKY